MTEQTRNGSDFWDDLAPVVDGDEDAIKKHADLLADSDEHRDARHDAARIAGALADAGADYEAPADIKDRVLYAIDMRGQKDSTDGASPQGGPQAPKASEPRADSSRTRPSAGGTGDKGRGKVVWLFGLAAAAVVLLGIGGVGIWALVGGDGTGPNGPVAAMGSGTLSGTLAVVERAAADGQSGVSIRAAGQGAFSPAVAGAVLAPGAALRTDERTRVRLDLSDGSVLVLNHATEIVLDGQTPRQIQLPSGEVVADVAHLEQGPRAVFTTPTGRVEVLGTKFVLSATDELASVRVTRGTVRVHGAAGGEADVKAGEEGLMPKSAQVSVSPATHLAESVSWSELGGRVEGTEEPIRGIGELRARRPGERQDRERPLTLAHHKATVRIVGNVARTEVEETFQNDSSETLEGIYRFPMPPDAQIASLSLEVDGRWEEGAFVERDRAQKIWRGVLRNATPRTQRQAQEEFIWVPGPWRDPALLEWQRGGQFELRIFPIPARGGRSVRLSYTQTIAPNGPTGRRYVLPLAHSADQSTRVGQFEVDVRLGGQDPETVRTHGYEMSKSQEDNATRLRYVASNFLPAGDMIVDYSLPNEDAEVRWWSFSGQATVPPAERSREGNPDVVRAQQALHDDGRGYVLFALRPHLPAWTESHARDYVIVVDSSQSMVGERFSRAAQLASGIVSEMDRRDRFMLLACDATCRIMADAPASPSAQSSAQVGTWLGSLQPAGASDLSRAMREAVASMQGKRNPDRDVRILYIGDGSPSIGPRSTASLAAEAQALGNDAGMTLTTVGIGGDADATNLAAMARAGGGHYVPYVPGQRVGTAALAVLETTYGVSLEAPSVRMPEGVVEIAPEHLATIRAGEEVLVAGRIVGNQVRGEIELRGKVGGREFSNRYPVSLDVSTAQGNAFVPRMWASGTIGQLDLEGRGENAPRMVALSKSFGVMSRHTSLLVLESEAMFRAFGVDRGQPTLQWTGDEDMEMGESQGVEQVAGAGMGRGDAAGGLGLMGAASGGGGSAAGPPAPSARRARAPAADMAEAAAEPAPREEERSAAVQTTVAEQPPMTRRPPGRGQWMRRVWFREGQVSDRVETRPADLRAVAQAESALRLSPDSRDRHRDLAKALARAGDLDRAREVVESWIERDRLDPEALISLADVMARQGKRDDAVRTLSGIVDLRPDDVSLQERLAAAFEQAGLAERACAHRVALAEIRRSDADSAVAAMRCESGLGRAPSADRILTALGDETARERARVAAAVPVRPTPVRGDLMLNATWSGGTDVDIALISPQGQRISWMGGRRGVVGEAGTNPGMERLGLRYTPAGSYAIEVSRAVTGDTTPVAGQVEVTVLGTRRSIPFTLTAERTVVGRVDVLRQSRMVPM